jgi:hypothetical protein
MGSGESLLAEMEVLWHKFTVQTTLKNLSKFYLYNVWRQCTSTRGIAHGSDWQNIVIEHFLSKCSWIIGGNAKSGR